LRFSVEAAVFERFPGLRLPVAVVTRLGQEGAVAEVGRRWAAAWAAAARHAEHGNAQSHPFVRPWRERFAAMGVSGKQFPSSVEALLRRALKGGEPFRINPLVDFYNTVSLEHLAPAGGFDLADIDEHLELRLTRAGDAFLALDGEIAEAVPPGEVAYATGADVLTRHFVWRQARRALVNANTSDAFLVAEVLPELGDNAAEAVAEAFRTGLRDLFGADAATFVIEERKPGIVR
jgi:DNA/RNA-binding domain of Phe-tRNA-synthetase-like protein